MPAESSPSARTIAIGDIHGCSAALGALIDAIDPQPDDTIIPLGDVIDRGPDSRGAIDMLIELSGRCHLVPLLGNHEEMLLTARIDPDSLAALSAWLRNGGAATLESYGPGTGPQDLPAEHVDFIESCIEYYETDTHVFVHANYDANLPFDKQFAYKLHWESLRARIPERHISGKTVVVGHTPQRAGQILDRGYLKCIDTGCYGGSWLTALDVDTGQLWQANQQGELREQRREAAVK